MRGSCSIHKVPTYSANASDGRKVFQKIRRPEVCRGGTFLRGGVGVQILGVSFSKAWAPVSLFSRNSVCVIIPCSRVYSKSEFQ